MKHFVNKSLGKRCIIYLLKLYYSELPDVESDLVISQVVYVSTTCSIQLSTYSCDCCINYCGFDVCHKYFSILMKHGTRKL